MSSQYWAAVNRYFNLWSKINVHVVQNEVYKAWWLILCKILVIMRVMMPVSRSCASLSPQHWAPGCVEPTLDTGAGASHSLTSRWRGDGGGGRHQWCDTLWPLSCVTLWPLWCVTLSYGRCDVWPSWSPKVKLKSMTVLILLTVPVLTPSEVYPLKMSYERR